MNLIELSIEQLQEECTEWADEIIKEYQPDLIIYIAKGGFLIGQEFQKVFKCHLVGVNAVRKGNKLKERLMPILSHMPKTLLNWARKVEMRSGFHNKHQERTVEFHKSISNIHKKEIDNILIVDDSVDTGNSLKSVRNEVVKHYPQAKVKTAGFNVWEQSFGVIQCDYFKYRNTILRLPMSKDSKEYLKFMKIYNEKSNNGEI